MNHSSSVGLEKSRHSRSQQLMEPAVKPNKRPTPRGKCAISIQVLCVDDHAILREGLAGIISADEGMNLAGDAANGKDVNITEDTVKVHIKRIFEKLDVIDRTQAVVSASQRGFIQLAGVY